MTTDAIDCFAIVAPGLESFALAEAQALGLDAKLEEGGFAWTGDARSALLANAGLRIASRVLVRLASFEARSFAELERHARKVGWPRVLKAGDSVRFRVTCKKSRLYHSDAVAQRLADAVTRVVPGVRAHGGSVTEDEVVDDDTALIVVRVMRDRVTVSADSSGALLHRRGYRQATAKAPLRETIAAAMLAASGWDDSSPLVDPLCGSGTIPIEAAMRARRLAPGAHRTFAMERWPTVPRTLGAEVRSGLAERALPAADAIIIGSDRDAGAITAATSNADRAGVTDDVRWAERSLSAARFPDSGKGWVVTNPPYGVRVGDADRVRDLWAQLGNVLRDRASGWTVALLSPDAALERQLKIPLRVVATTSNGGIPVRVMIGQVPA
ncbi:MAG: methylase [Gemmatimonadetes bacterium]|nr:methylase [Gemmatimonadota bacterium]